MIHFVSSFPPLVCGIGSYTNYLAQELGAECKVTSFRPDHFSKGTSTIVLDRRVTYRLSLDGTGFPSFEPGDVAWFQHAFGMWGNDSNLFLNMVVRAKRSGTPVIATFHTVHFESRETESGLSAKEECLMRSVLPHLDAATVFSDGAYCALARTFPEFKSKLTVLRHGVHQYQLMDRRECRIRLLGHLLGEPEEGGVTQRTDRDYLTNLFLDPDTVILGNCGFISRDKDPESLYDLGSRVRRRIGNKSIVTLYVGKIQDRKDKATEETAGILQNLRSIHDGKENLFFEHYLPEGLLPVMFRSLDFSVFWCKNATQSGRMAHAQGSGTCAVGRRIEGLGETLDRSGLPSGISLDDMADKVAYEIRNPNSKERIEALSAAFAEHFSFTAQARKHNLLAQLVQVSGDGLPSLDRTEPELTFILPRLAIAGRSGLEHLDTSRLAFLNVADDTDDLHPFPRDYGRIALSDGCPIQSDQLKRAVEWIDSAMIRSPVVVFCRYGKGRSASIAIAYLCLIWGLSYEDAVELVRGKRSGANPLPHLDRAIYRVFEEARDNGCQEIARGATTSEAVR
jgi:glycosyltransferase involved in cell wall biosynthesis